MPGIHATLPHREVVAEIPMRLISVPAGLPVSASLTYTTRDPFALTAVFAADGCPPVRWVFARDLLLDGLSRPAGHGDVRIYPAGGRVVFELASPDGAARLVAGASHLAAFAQGVVAVVPPGQESAYVDVDAELGTLGFQTLAEWGEA